MAEWKAWAGRSGRSGLQWAASLYSGEKRFSNFMTLAIHSLAVMHWFLAAATGRDAKRDALLGQHLTDFVPVIPLIPDHRGRRRQVKDQIKNTLV